MYTDAIMRLIRSHLTLSSDSLFVDNTRTLHRLSDKRFPITSRRPSCRGTPKRLSDCVFTSSLSYSGPCTVRALNITCSGTMGIEYLVCAACKIIMYTINLFLSLFFRALRQWFCSFDIS